MPATLPPVRYATRSWRCCRPPRRYSARRPGIPQRNAQGDGIEHFGYIDGRSQPLFLTEDLASERDGSDGTNAWDPAAPLGQVLVPDPATHFGSYFIFRKLEQNVRRFFQAEDDRERRPIGGVGLLFMAFNSTISTDNIPTSQFDFTQQLWADNVNFPRVPAGTPQPGLDPVIGQGTRPPQTYPTHWAAQRQPRSTPSPKQCT